MARPCKCGGERCAPCGLYRTSPRLRAAWDADPAPPPAAPAAEVLADCRHRADEATNGRRLVALGLSTLREWRECALGHGLHGHVCGCKAWPEGGCKGCPDHAPE